VAVHDGIVIEVVSCKQAQDDNVKSLLFSGQQVLQEGLGRTVSDDPLVNSSNRRKTAALPFTVRLYDTCEPIFYADLVTPRERVTDEEHSELLVLLLNWFSVSVTERVGPNIDPVIRINEVGITRPPEYRMVLNGPEIPRMLLIDSRFG
jgi:hypothetical protein